MKRSLLSGVVLLALILPAWAWTYSAATVGTSDGTILSTTTGVRTLDVVSNSPTATVCLKFGATATISAGVCAAGEITIPPLWHKSFTTNEIPYGSGDGALHAISSAASTPLSVGSN